MSSAPTKHKDKKIDKKEDKHSTKKRHRSVDASSSVHFSHWKIPLRNLRRHLTPTVGGGAQAATIPEKSEFGTSYSFHGLSPVESSVRHNLYSNMVMEFEDVNLGDTSFVEEGTPWSTRVATRESKESLEEPHHPPPAPPPPPVKVEQGGHKNYQVKSIKSDYDDVPDLMGLPRPPGRPLPSYGEETTFLTAVNQAIVKEFKKKKVEQPERLQSPPPPLSKAVPRPHESQEQLKELHRLKTYNKMDHEAENWIEVLHRKKGGKDLTWRRLNAPVNVTKTINTEVSISDENVLGPTSSATKLKLVLKHRFLKNKFRIIGQKCTKIIINLEYRLVDAISGALSFWEESSGFLSFRRFRTQQVQRVKQIQFLNGKIWQGENWKGSYYLWLCWLHSFM